MAPSRRAVLASGLLAAIGGAGCLGDSTGAEDPPPRNTSEPPPTTPTNESRDGGENDPPEEPPEDLLDDFEDLSRWQVLSGSVTADRSASMTGERCARIDIEAAESRALLVRSFEEPVDLAGCSPVLVMRSEDTIYPRIRLTDASGDWLEFRTAVRGEMPLHYVNFGISAIEGDPDLTVTEEIRILMHVGDDRHRLWMDDLRIATRPTPGIVSIHFDDTLETEYTEALPILEAHDMAASTFINPGYVGRTVGGSPRLSLDQLGALQDAGWVIGNHAMSHGDLAEVDTDSLHHEIRDAHTWLHDHGFDRGAGYFVYPYSNYRDEAVEIVAKDHDLAFAGGWAAVGTCANPHLIPRASGDPDFATAKADIETTIRSGGITTLFYHKLHGDRLEDFRKTIGYIARKRDAGALRVKTVDALEGRLTTDPAFGRG